MEVPRTSVLFTDLYQLTMLQAYHRHGFNDMAVFEFFTRKLPTGRNFLLAAGLEQVLHYLETLRFEDHELNWLKQTGRFQPDFLESLAKLRFTGDVHAMPEGTAFFPKRTDSARDGSAAGGPTRRITDYQPAAVPDADRLEGGAVCARRAGEASGRLRHAAGSRSRSRPICRARHISGGF